MSVTAMTWAKGRAETIASQAVLFALADYADEWGITYVGQDTLASDCSCRKATVSQNLARLEQQRLIGRVRRHDEKGHRTSDHVVLAPLAADRGGMRDADKRAREKHPREVCELAKTLDTPSATRGADLDTPRVEPRYASRADLDTPSVPEPSVEPSVEPSGAKAPSASASARDGKVELPDEFPQQLRPHMEAVFRVLRRVAEHHNVKAINPLSLAHVFMAPTRRHKPFVAAAHDFGAWAIRPENRRVDVVAAYRNWLDRTPDLAGVERLAPSADTTGNVVPIERPAALRRADAWRAGYGRDAS